MTSSGRNCLVSNYSLVLLLLWISTKGKRGISILMCSHFVFNFNALVGFPFDAFFGATLRKDCLGYCSCCKTFKEYGIIYTKSLGKIASGSWPLSLEDGPIVVSPATATTAVFVMDAKRAISSHHQPLCLVQYTWHTCIFQFFTICHSDLRHF